MYHIMLDLETWGTKPGCDIRSIGACVFDPGTGFVHDGSLGTFKPFYQACSNSVYPLTRDPKTVEWWNKQSVEAQSAFDDPMDIPFALVEFTRWISVFGNTARIWSHGASFDTPILAAAYDICDLFLPWHYRAPRDTRTLFDLAGIDDHSAFLAKFNTSTHHHALDDAICQAKAVCEAWKLTKYR